MFFRICIYVPRVCFAYRENLLVSSGALHSRYWRTSRSRFGDQRRFPWQRHPGRDLAFREYSAERCIGRIVGIIDRGSIGFSD